MRRARCSADRSWKVVGYTFFANIRFAQLLFFRICFQVPAIASEYGVTLVVSPLLGE